MTNSVKRVMIWKENNDHSIGEGLAVNIRKSMTIPLERTLM